MLTIPRVGEKVKSLALMDLEGEMNLQLASIPGRLSSH
jgi:hypothetical protein